MSFSWRWALLALLVVPLVLANVNIGILAVFAVGSLGVYSLIVAGWSSNSKYPFLGGVRASAQLISYELSLGLAPVVVNRLIPKIRAFAESGIGVLLIEQFATVALGLAHHAHVMEGGRLRFSGLASELREQPERLRSAYLLRGSGPGGAAEPTGDPG